MLAERLLLLCWDAQRGTPVAGVQAKQLNRALAAAILAELVLRRRLDGTADALCVPDNLPDYTVLISEGAAILRRNGNPISVTAAVHLLSSRMSRLRERVIASLVARDILHEYGTPMFRRHPMRSMQSWQEAHAELKSCGHNRNPRPAALALAAIFDGAGLLTTRVECDDASAIRDEACAILDDVALLATPATQDDASSILDDAGLLATRITQDDASAIRAALARARTGTTRADAAGEIALLLAIGTAAAGE